MIWHSCPFFSHQTKFLMIDASFLHKRALSLSSKGEKSLNFGENNSFNNFRKMGCPKHSISFKRSFWVEKLFKRWGINELFYIKQTIMFYKIFSAKLASCTQCTDTVVLQMLDAIFIPYTVGWILKKVQLSKTELFNPKDKINRPYVQEDWKKFERHIYLFLAHCVPVWHVRMLFCSCYTFIPKPDTKNVISLVN